VRLPQAQLREGARLGPYLLPPARDESLSRFVHQNRWLLGGGLLLLVLHLYNSLALRRLARKPVPPPPASIGEVVFSDTPIQPADLALKRRPDWAFPICGTILGALLGVLIWAGSLLVGNLTGSLPFSLDWIWKSAAWAGLVCSLLELFLWESLERADYVGQLGLARFRFTLWSQVDLVLFREIDRVEQQELPGEKILYRWLNEAGLARLELHEKQGDPGFASAALVAWHASREG
jgi:hypothetical protein